MSKSYPKISVSLYEQDIEHIKPIQEYMQANMLGGGATTANAVRYAIVALNRCIAREAREREMA